MNRVNILFSALLILIISACTSSGLSEDELATLNEAKVIHDEAYSIQGQVDAMMAQIAEHKNFMQVALSNNSESQADEIAQEEVEKIKGLLLEIETVEEELNNWKAELIEVEIPGEEHDHDHEGHDHNHGSNNAEDILPNQMLELQKEQRNIIQTIQAKAAQLLVQCQQYVTSASENIDE